MNVGNSCVHRLYLRCTEGKSNGIARQATREVAAHGAGIIIWNRFSAEHLKAWGRHHHRRNLEPGEQDCFRKLGTTLHEHLWQG